MKLKHLSILFFWLALATSCTDDDIVKPSIPINENGSSSGISDPPDKDDGQNKKINNDTKNSLIEHEL